MPANVRQLILGTLKHSTGWNQERLKAILQQCYKIPPEVSALEIDKLVNEDVVERQEDGFVSLPDIEPSGFLTKMLLGLQNILDRFLTALQRA